MVRNIRIIKLFLFIALALPLWQCTDGGLANLMKNLGLSSSADTSAPTVPAAFSASPGGSNQINLSWTASTANVSPEINIYYEICHSTVSGGCETFTAISTTPAGALAYSVTGLEPNTIYFFKIRAADESGNTGEASAEATSTTSVADTANSPTFNPAGGTYMAIDVTLNSATSGATICYTNDGVSTPSCDLNAICASGTTFMNPIRVSSNQTIQAIACKSTFGASPVSSAAYTIDTTAPNVPGAFVAAAGGANQINLSWNASADNLSAAANITYEICQGISSTACASFAATYTTNGGAVSYVVNGLLPITTYYFKIRAKDALGNISAVSTEAFSTTNSVGTLDTPTFSPVSGVYAAAINNVSLNSIAGATVCYTTDGVNTPACNASVICTTGNTYTGSTLIPVNADMTIKALACKSTYTNSAVANGVFTIDTTPPVAGNSGTIGISNITGTGVTLTWAAATDPGNITPQANITYRIYYSTSNNISTIAEINTPNGTAFGSAMANITTANVTGLSPLTQYYFNVVISDSVGNQAAYAGTMTTTINNAKNITAFSFDATSNGLNQTYNGTITGTNIAVLLPSTNITLAVASFTTTGSTVKIGAVTQSSGFSYNNYTNPVTYTVIAQDNTTQNYTVTVTPVAMPNILALDTGMTSCYDDMSPGNVITCNGAGGSFPFQDGFFANTPKARNFSSPTFDATFTNDYITIDNINGLIWKTCSEGTQTGATCTGGSIQPFQWTGAVGACTTQNTIHGSTGYASRTNWRLPTIVELRTLMDYSLTNPAINAGLFPGTSGSYYWSSTASIMGPSTYAWVADFVNGSITTVTKSPVSYPVRCVSSGP